MSPLFPARSARVALSAALVLALATATRAEIAPEAEAKKVIDRYVAAIGGRESWERVHSTRFKGSLTAFGLSGTTEAWTQAPDRRASSTRIGPFSLREGYDGIAAWRTDPGGKLLMLDGKDLETAKGSGWFENERFLAADQGGGKIAYVGLVKDSTGEHEVLEITPPAGRARKFFFNPATGLIDRAEVKSDQQMVVNVTSDYRRVDGRLVPFQSVTAIVDMPANTVTVTLDSVWFNAPIDPAVFSPPEAQALPVTWLKQAGVAKLPFEYRGRHLWVRVSVNGGPPADFIYDTGASITVIDSAYAARIGLKTEGAAQAQGAGAAGSASFSQLHSIRVVAPDSDGVELKDHKVGVLSVNGILAPFFWRDCAGVLGFNFISQFVNEIDYDNRMLTLLDPKEFRYSGRGEKVPFALAGTVPAVRMSLDNKHEGFFRLDVGSSGTVDLHGPFVKEKKLDKLAGKSIEVTGGGFGGTFTNRVRRMKEIQLGPYTWNHPLVSLSGAKTGALTSEDYAGNVGNRILERFKCTFDYQRRDIYLEPGRKFEQPDHLSRAGVQLARFGEEIKAMQVLKGSPAEAAGLREGDTVLSIDGKAPLDWNMDELMKLLEEGPLGQRVEFLISSAGAQRKIIVTLKDVI